MANSTEIAARTTSAASDGESGWLNSHAKFWWAVALSALLLLPVVFFPLSPDLAIFTYGGRVLLEGGEIYRDFIDVKPPLVYYLMAIVQLVFGDSEPGIRLFDFVWQLGVCISLLFIVRRSGFSPRVAALSATLYALLYTSLSAASTMQCESFAGLLILWALFNFRKHPRRAASQFLCGLMLGLALCLKYTLALVVPALLLYELLNSAGRMCVLLRRWTLIAGGLAVAVLLGLVWPLSRPGVWEHFVLNVNFTLEYNSLQALDGVFLRYVLTRLPALLADQLSIAVCSGVGAALVLVFGRRSAGFKQRREAKILWLYVVIVLMCSVVAERKLFVYHLSRTFVLLAPLCAIGLMQLYRLLRAAWNDGDRHMRGLIFFVTGSLLLFSPLPRFVKWAVPAGLYFVDRDAYDRSYELTGSDNSMIRLQYREVADYVNSCAMPGENIAVVSFSAAMLYRLLDLQRLPKFPGRQFYSSSAAPELWRREFYAELNTAEWLIVQTNDRHPIVTGADDTASDFLHDDIHSRAILQTRFVRDTSFASFVVFRSLERARR